MPKRNKSISAHIVLDMRERFNYTQEDVATWIQVERSTFSRKERGLIPFTADEFLTILVEFDSRGPRPESPPKDLVKLVKKYLHT